MVASAILADVEPWLTARRNRVAIGKTMVKSDRFTLRTLFPGDPACGTALHGRQRCLPPHPEKLQLQLVGGRLGHFFLFDFFRFLGRGIRALQTHKGQAHQAALKADAGCQ